MQIQKGYVKYKDRSDIICNYAVTDDGRQYYFLGANNERLANGNIIASKELVEAIDPMVQASNIGVIDENGNETTYDVLFTFDSEETNKSYIVYTDNTKDASGSIQVYASVYDPNDPNSKLEPIETEKEWKVIETILNTLQEEVRNKSKKDSDVNNEQ